MTHAYSSAPSPKLPTVPSRVRSTLPLIQKHLLAEIALGVFLVILVVFLLFLCFKKRLFCAFKKSWQRKGMSHCGKVNLRRFQLEELEKATNNFSEECMVGSGAFGNVYKGTFKEEGMLAIKRAHADSYQSVCEFRNEVELLAKVKHGNLLGLIGFCEESGQKALVYEYVPNGSLLDYIIGRRGKTMTWRQRVSIAIGAAKGIAHLHEGVKPGIIHRDIKPSNILIGHEFEAKVSDFGLVKSGPIGDASHVSSQIKGTPGYLDPAYCSSFHLTPYSDVYSFGVILLQLVTARPAVDACRNSSRYHIVDWARPSIEEGKIEDIIDANLLMEPCNMEMMLKMGQLGLRCVEKVPKNRPTMTQVWQQLEEALDSCLALIHKHPSRGNSLRLAATGGDHCKDCLVSIDGMGLQRFHMDMESVSMQSASLRRFELSVSMDAEKHNYLGKIREGAS